MAFGSVGALISDNNTTANITSWTTSATLGNALAAGNLGVVIHAIDNMYNTGASSQVYAVTDSVGNAWFKAGEYTLLGGAIGGGGSVSIWYCIADTTLTTSGTLTFSYTQGNVNAISRACTGWVYTIASGKRVAPRARAFATATNANAPSMTLSSLPNVEHLFVRAIAREGNGTGWTSSTNYTAFTTGSNAIGNTGTTATSMTARGEWRILTGTSDTSAPSFSTNGDQANIFVDFVEYADTLLHPTRQLAVSFDATNTTTYNTASISPAANKLLIAWVYTKVASGTPAIPTVTGGGVTWSLAVSQDHAATNSRASCFYALTGASPGSAAVNFDFGSETETRIGWAIEEYTGFSGYSLPQTTSGTSTTAGTFTLTLSAMAASSSASLAGYFYTASINGGLAEPTNNEAPISQRATEVNTEFFHSLLRYDGQTTMVMDYTNGGTISGAIGLALEVAENTGTTVTLSGISSAEAFGGITLNRTVTFSGIASAEAFGTVTERNTVTLSGISSAEAFGTLSLSPAINLTGIASAEAFGTTTLNRNLSLTGITSAEAFGTLSLADALNLSGISSAEAFGGITLNRTVTFSGIASEEAFGTSSLADTLQLSGIASAEAFGTITLNRNVSLAGIASAEAFGTTSFPDIISLDGVSSEEAFGSLNISSIDVFELSGIPSTEAFGTTTLNRNATLSGIVSAESFGTLSVADALNLDGIPSEEAFGDIAFIDAFSLTGIPSSEAFGNVSVSRNVTLAGISSAEAFGTISLNGSIYLSGIPSAEAFGNTTFSGTDYFSLTGIASAEAFGTTRLDRTVELAGIASEEAFGTASISDGNIVDFTGIPSAEAFGSITISKFIVLSGIPSAEAFGTLRIKNVPIQQSEETKAGLIVFEETYPVILVTETETGPMKLARGTSRDLLIPIVDQGGNPFNPVGHTVRVLVKKNVNDPEESAVIVKTSDDVSEIELSSTEIRVHFVPSDTWGLDIGMYYYDALIYIDDARYVLMEPEQFYIFRSVSEVLS